MQKFLRGGGGDGQTVVLFPSLVRRGSRAAAGWSVQSPAKRLLIDAREAHLIVIGTFVLEQTAPALATRGHPRLTKAGNRSSHIHQFPEPKQTQARILKL